jgi:hypothetical protein
VSNPAIIAQQSNGPSSMNGALTNPLAVNSAALPNKYGDAAVVTTVGIATNVPGAFRSGDYAVALVPNGAVDYTADFQIGDGTSWADAGNAHCGAWGQPFTFVNALISYSTPLTIYVRFKAAAGDPGGMLAVGLDLPQDGIRIPVSAYGDTAGGAAIVLIGVGQVMGGTVITIGNVGGATGGAAIAASRTQDTTGGAAIAASRTQDTTGGAAMSAAHTNDTTGGLDIAGSKTGDTSGGAAITVANLADTSGAAKVITLGADSNLALIFLYPFTGTSGHPSSTNWLLGGDDAGTGDNGVSGDFINGPNSGHQLVVTLAGNQAHVAVPAGGVTSGPGLPVLSLKSAAMSSATTDQVVEMAFPTLPTYNHIRRNLFARGTLASRGLMGVAGFTGYTAIVDANSIFLALYVYDGASATQLGSNYDHTPAAGDVVKLSCIGTTISVILNGTAVISVTDSTYSSGTAGWYYDAYDWINAWTDDVPCFVVYKSNSIGVSGLSTGMYVRLSDGTNVSDAAWSSGTLTVSLGAVVCGEAGCTVQVYQGNPASGGRLLIQRTGYYGGAIAPVS